MYLPKLSSKRHTAKPLQQVAFIHYSSSELKTFVTSQFCYNMALRANHSKESSSKDESSAVAGLSQYWHDPQKKPNIVWRKWSDLFAVAMTAKYSIAISEVLRVVTNEQE